MRYKRKLEKEIMCPLEYGLEIFGGKWKSRIICVLATKENFRYNELKTELNNISDVVLSDMLKELLNDEMISRTQFNEVPMRVEYALTAKGKSVLPILQSICEFSKKHSKKELEMKISACIKCEHVKS